MRKLIKYTYLILWVFFAQSTKAEVFQITEIKPEYTLTNHLEILHDQSKELSFEKIQTLSQSFIPFKSWQNEFEPKSVYWAKIELDNKISSAFELSEWVFLFSPIFTDIHLYVVYENGKTEHHRSGFFVPYAERTFAPIVKVNLAKIYLPVGKKATIYFRGANERYAVPSNFDLTLQHSTTFFSELEKEKQWNAMFIGFVVMMFFYSLFLFIYAKDKSYYYYSFYLLGISLFTMHNSGDMADFINRTFSIDKPQIVYFFKLSTYLTITGYFAFIRHFLDLKNLLPRWDKIFKTLAILCLPVALLDGVLMWSVNYSYIVADKITIGWSLIYVLICFAFLVPLFRTGDRKGRFIVLGFSMAGIGILLTIYLRMQSIDFSVIFLRIGIILEIILFSLGVAYRQKEVEQEKQNASFELEKSKILQDLEQKETERLKELNTLKSQLYANITHEFRTPLTVIMGMTNNLKNNEQAKELILRNSQNLLQLINQLLDLSKAESGKLEVKMMQGDIINFLRYLTESFHSMAAAKDIQLTFYTEEKELLMDFDEQKIQHIIYNLLSNAIKYTPEKGKVIFHVKEENDYLTLKVKDNGLGIKQEDQEFIFDRFYKVDNSSTKKVDGVGIGLALTKELVEILDGKITVESELGEGSEFVVKLPITNEAKDLKITPSKKKILPEITSPKTEEEKTTPAFADLNSNKDQPLLLLIEDNEDVVTYIKSCLKDDYQLLVTYDGEAGVNKALEIVPDVIISDLMMPKKDGFEVCNILKNDERTSHIPIILLTAKASQEDKLEGLETGADAYMMKPFNQQELLIRLKNLIRAKEALHAKYGQGLLAIPKKPKTLEDEFLQKIITAIEEELDNPNLSVAELSKKLHLSPTQMYRKLKAVTGFPPTKFIRRFRLQKGLELLQTTPKTIAEIAYLVGFNDPNYFSRSFSEEFGKTPSDIRK